MTAALLHLSQEALVLALLLSAAPLLAALLTGMVTGLLQAVTQVQDPALGAVPRIAAVLSTLAVAGPWMGGRLVAFAREALALATGGQP